MSRVLNRGAQMVIDLVILLLTFWLAFLLRFEGDIPVQMVKRAPFLSPYVVMFQYLVLLAAGVPRQVWRYVGLREVRQVLGAALLFGSVLLLARLVAGLALPRFGYAQYALLPVGVIIIDTGLVFLGITGVRVLRRVHIERRDTERRRDSKVELVPTMLIGAGQAGVMIAKEILARPDLGIKPVGFLDDDAMKIGTVVHGLRVHGPSSQVAALCAKQGARQALITIASAQRSEIRALVERCNDASINAKIIPALYEIVSGQVELSRIRSVTIEDLLGREPVVLDEEALAAFIKDRRVLVTGAGGSIGSEICRQVVRCGPAQLVLVERNENGLFQIDRELGPLAESVTVVPCVADITDETRMRAIMGEHRPEVLLHAAAHKHVPLMERNVGEAIRNNVLGTKLVADLAVAFKVGSFVMISTDKAVNPTAVMGATKRIAEMYTQALSQHGSTRFVTVRFGNVLGSVGSVVPIFKAQIARGGPVTVTHPDMKRYFMTIPEACQLVLQAATMGEGGEIFILDMGEPIKIVDLARDLIRLSGLKPNIDIEILFTGVRAGEKLFEELATNSEHVARTKHPKIFVGKQSPCVIDDVNRSIAELAKRVASPEGRSSATDGNTLRGAIAEIVPEYVTAPSRRCDENTADNAKDMSDDSDTNNMAEASNGADADSKVPSTAMVS